MSQWPVARDNRLENNYIGFYFRWGVRHGLVEKHVILNNSQYGVRLGQKDTHNVVRGNEIRNRGKVGVMFQKVEGGREYSPDRNSIEENKIVDNGTEHGIANDITISNNAVIENGRQLERIGIRIGPETGNIQLAQNQIRDFSVNCRDLRSLSVTLNK